MGSENERRSVNISSKSTFKKLNDIYYNLPWKIIKVLNVLIKRGIIRFIKIVQNIFFDVYLITGIEKNSKKPISILVSGNKRTLHYVPRRIFGSEYSAKRIGRHSIWSINKLIEKNYNNVDLIFLNTDRFLRRFLKKSQFSIIPEWVNMKLDTSKSLPEIHSNFSKGAKRDIKKIDKFGFEYEVTKDPVRLKNFYENMFLPHILQSHGEETPESYLRYIRFLSQKIRVLLVKEGDKDVCGGLIEVINDESRLPSMGVLNSDKELLKKCVISALYYFHIIYAKEINIKSLDYGETRSFLDDGGFQFKRKWGLEVTYPKYDSGIIGLKILNENQAVRNFLMNNPCILQENNKFMGLVYNYKSEPTNIDEVNQFIKSYYTKGLSKFFIISPSGFTDECKKELPYNKRLPKKYNKEICLFPVGKHNFKALKIEI